MFSQHLVVSTQDLKEPYDAGIENPHISRAAHLDAASVARDYHDTVNVDNCSAIERLMPRW